MLAYLQLGNADLLIDMQPCIT